MPEDMAAQINNKIESYILPSDDPNQIFKYAPGEGKIPTNPLTEENMDAKAFPRHHPSGRFGYNYLREFKLSPSLYYNQRTMNKGERFSKDTLLQQ